MQQLQPNTLLHGGTYKIERALGQGSFGITYLAEHTSLGKKVAIKEFFMKDINSRLDDGSITGITDGSLSYNYAQKFRKEAMNLARMEHPNIVRVTDSFDENGTFYYVMDYIDGCNLNDYVKKYKVSEKIAVEIIRSTANALIYMHEDKHMLHLDLKPGNIMRRASDGHIFLIDFGLSKHYDNNGAPETSTTIGLGTAGYAPIEQSNQAKNGEFRPTIDVYALGATLYKLLTRETPPAASELVSDDELIKQALRTKGVSAQLVSVVEKAMMPSVKKRTQSVRAFLDLFTSYGNDTTISSTETIIESEENEYVKPFGAQEETVFVGEKERDQKQTPQNIQPSSQSATLDVKTSKKSSKTLVFTMLFAIVIGCIIYFANKLGPHEVQNETIVLTSGHDSKRNFVYTGTVDENNVPNGQGKASYPETKSSSSATFEGLFVNGLPSKGEMVFSSGMKYSGTFTDKGFYLEGTLTDSEGYYFKGSFMNGKPFNGKWYTPHGQFESEVINGG